MTVVLTIAGSDSGGGAGIQADLKTFEAHGVFGTSAITSITAQNTKGVRAVHDVPSEVVGQQIEAVFDDFDVKGIKIGMLSSAAIIGVVTGLLEKYASEIPVVLDPVMVATSGDRLLKDDALELMAQRLIPLAYLVTPNIAEAEVLSGYKPTGAKGVLEAARTIHRLGPENVLVKGGDRNERDDRGERVAQDILYDGERSSVLSEKFVESTSTHGTGCTLSSAIAANLACGMDLLPAIRRAKNYVTLAIQSAPGLGGGHGPLLHRVAVNNI